MPAPRPKILLVDDVEFILETERLFLQRTPADILTARSATAALALIHRERPQLVYLDVSLPDLNGMECCRQIKADPFLRLIPVVMVFAAAAEIPGNATAVCGCDDALAKPLERKAFLNCGYRFLFEIERREKRVPCRVPVSCRFENTSWESVSGDISQHGIYVQSRTPTLPGTMVTVSFTLPHGGVPIEGHGRVAWINQGFPRTNMDLPQGFGVQFLQLAPSARDLIVAFIGQHQELQPEGHAAQAAVANFLGA